VHCCILCLASRTFNPRNPQIFDTHRFISPNDPGFDKLFFFSFFSFFQVGKSVFGTDDVSTKTKEKPVRATPVAPAVAAAAAATPAPAAAAAAASEGGAAGGFTGGQVSGKVDAKFTKKKGAWAGAGVRARAFTCGTSVATPVVACCECCA